MAERHSITTKGGTFHLEVEGAQELRRAMRRAGDKELPKQLRQTNKSAAELVKTRAVPKVPVLSGRLQRSVKALGTQSGGHVKAGSASRVPYAPPIHWGWAARGISPNRFIWDAKDEVWRDGTLAREYEKGMELVLRAARLKGI